MAIVNWKSVDKLKSKVSLYIRLIINIFIMCFAIVGFVTIPYIIITGHKASFQIIDGITILFSLVLFVAMFFGMLYEAKLVIKRLKSADYIQKR
ncbi:MAG: hypothetical protein AB7U79_08405 [Candidatus Izemoplasmatales bacterium]